MVTVSEWKGCVKQRAEAAENSSQITNMPLIIIISRDTNIRFFSVKRLYFRILFLQHLKNTFKSISASIILMRANIYSILKF